MKKLFYILAFFFAFIFICDTNADAQPKKPKKHWSHRKKDAVIGGSAGAVTGAVVSKHPVKGAIIGGAIGTGAGYVIGKKERQERSA